MSWFLNYHVKRLSDKLARLRREEEGLRQMALIGEDEQLARDYVETTKRAKEVAKKLRKLGSGLL